MEYYPVIKKNKIRPFATTGMNLEIIIQIFLSFVELKNKKKGVEWRMYNGEKLY